MVIDWKAIFKQANHRVKRHCRHTYKSSIPPQALSYQLAVLSGEAGSKYFLCCLSEMSIIVLAFKMHAIFLRDLKKEL